MFVGLFSKKPIYKCKVLEKYKIDPYELSQYQVVGETATYRIYSYKADSTLSTYLLRLKFVFRDTHGKSHIPQIPE